MSKTKSINLTGTETKAEFDRPFAYVECNNLSDGDVLISTKPNFKRGDDDVIIVKSGSSVSFGDIGVPKIKTVYLQGSGEVQIMGKGYPESSFKKAGKGGDVKPTPTGFDMTGITARFDVPGIDIENKIWVNSVEGGSELTFTEGSLQDNSLVIPEYENGQFPLEENPEVVYLVVKKPIMENDKIFLGVGSAYSTNHGYGLELGQGYNSCIMMFDTFSTPYIQIHDIDINKYHLLTAVKDFNNLDTMLCFCNGKYYGQIPTLHNDHYIGHVDLNRVYRRNDYAYQCLHPSYFKFIATGNLPVSEAEPLNYMKVVYHNMDWLMNNIVNPANEEV